MAADRRHLRDPMLHAAARHDETRTEVRMSDQDPEILAMKAMTQGLGQLDEETANRVLEWADARFGSGPNIRRYDALAAAAKRDSDMVSQLITNFTKALAAINEAAGKVGVTPQVLVRVIEQSYHKAAEHEPAASAGEGGS